MSVKVIDNTVVVVEAKHKERQDDQLGCISRHFLHRYRLPNNVDPNSVTSDLSDKGILTVTAKKFGVQLIFYVGLKFHFLILFV
ncbi:Heat shock protein Hsp-12.2, putative [Pediculus humanus corporis]|uniref:Heat shock protein Hsp-12.2, putative n=1 Tax=Pediculus humanus subsp. corporis TaxID=121224 RepID=E0VUK1_PEDHC|nr:Heat shock protein Hsp-12.2, putative [Pediculus humanus corporis]EEB17057.1 Heat shock protein Hsp-12.2, putative [Pediculus humanus corporis]